MCKCQATFGPNRVNRYPCGAQATRKVFAAPGNNFAPEVASKVMFYCAKHIGSWNASAWTVEKISPKA